MASIYALCDPDTASLRYIGKANFPRKRLAQHNRDANSRSTPVCRWIRSLHRRGLSPEMVILHEGCDDWQTVERSVIFRARAAYSGILNVADGGALPACDIKTRASNGKKSAKARDPFRWKTLRNLGSWAAEAENNGEPHKAALFRKAQAKARLFTDAQWASFKLKRGISD